MGRWVKVGSAEPFQLGVEIRKIATLKQRIIGKIDTRRDVLRHEGNLFGLGKEIVGHAVEDEAAYRNGRQDFFRYDLRRVENIEIETVGKSLIKELHL